MAAVLRLCVHGRVPVRVIEDDGIGSSQVDSETAAARREDEAEDSVVAVEALHEGVAALYRCGSIETQVGVAVVVEEDLEDVEHARHLGEEEGAGGRACVCVCVRACVRACVCMYACVRGSKQEHESHSSPHRHKSRKTVPPDSALYSETDPPKAGLLQEDAGLAVTLSAQLTTQHPSPEALARKWATPTQRLTTPIC